MNVLLPIGVWEICIYIYIFFDSEFLLICSLKLTLIMKPYVVPMCTTSFKVLERCFTSNPQIYFWVPFGVKFLPMKAALVLLGQPSIEELNGAHDGDEAKAYKASISSTYNINFGQAYRAKNEPQSCRYNFHALDSLQSEDDPTPT